MNFYPLNVVVPFFTRNMIKLKNIYNYIFLLPLINLRPLNCDEELLNHSPERPLFATKIFKI